MCYKVHVLQSSHVAKCSCWKGVAKIRILTSFGPKIILDLKKVKVKKIKFQKSFWLKQIQHSEVWCGVHASSWFILIFSHHFYFLVFHQRLSSTKGCLLPKVVFHWRSTSINGRPPPKVLFHWWSSSTDGRLPPKVFYHQRSSSTKCCPFLLFYRTF